MPPRRLVGDGQVTVTGRVFAERTPAGTVKRLLASADELETVLAEEFGIHGVAMAEVWPAISARHEEVFGARRP